MGSRPVSALPDLFSKKITAIKTGGISEPIVAPNGVHVIQLVDISANSNQVDERKVQEMLFQQKMQKKMETWLKKLRDTSYVKIVG